MTSQSSSETPFLADSNHDEENCLETRSSSRNGFSYLAIIFTTLFLCSLALNFQVVILPHIRRNHEIASSPFEAEYKQEVLLYSPAEQYVFYKMHKFDSSINKGITPYRGVPTEHNNKLWQDLYQSDVGSADSQSHISENDAKLLPNKPSKEKSYNESGYLLVLSVFHNLHCLDNLRQALYYFLDDQWTINYNPYIIGSGDPKQALRDFGGKNFALQHLDHCIDILRQDQMCSADITPTVFQWDEIKGEVLANADVVHECRDFERIVDWAKIHHAAFEGFDGSKMLGKCGAGDSWICLYT